MGQLALEGGPELARLLLGGRKRVDAYGRQLGIAITELSEEILKDRKLLWLPALQRSDKIMKEQGG